MSSFVFLRSLSLTTRLDCCPELLECVLRRVEGGKVEETPRLVLVFVCVRRPRGCEAWARHGGSRPEGQAEISGNQHGGNNETASRLSYRRSADRIRGFNPCCVMESEPELLFFSSHTTGKHCGFSRVSAIKLMTPIKVPQ